MLEATRQTLGALVRAVDKGHAALIWSEQACSSFGAEMGALVWFGSSPHGEGAESLVRELTGEAGTFSGTVSPKTMDELFGRGTSSGSVAIACIGKGDEAVGALTVGAADSEQYRREDGTLFLDYIAAAIGQLPACQ